jgi:hypothetical protein
VNFYDRAKKRNQSVVTINLGRRYIIESYDILLERYQESVKAEENAVVLDKLFVEYLNSKYRSNVIDLQINLTKAKVEPYLHINLTNVMKIMGQEEAQRKIMFHRFWQTVVDFSDPEKITADYDAWFDKNKKTPPVPELVAPTKPTNIN